MGYLRLLQANCKALPRFLLDFIRFTNIQAPDLTRGTLKHLQQAHHLFVSHAFVEILE
jgi:hypothetical protein